MSAEFNYGMSADASQALAESLKVEAGLTSVENHAKKVGAAMEHGFNTPALKNAKGQIVATSVSTGELASAFARIVGPVDQIEKDIKILNELQSQGALSAKQYADEWERIAKASGDVSPMHGPVQQKKPEKEEQGFIHGMTNGSEGLSEIAGHLTSIAGPAALAAKGIEAIGEAFERMAIHKEEMDKAQNSILKFHDSEESASDAMSEQIKLSGDLHLNLEKTSRAYADVREATLDMFLSSEQVVDVTRNLTAALVADGGSIEDVSGIMMKFQMAMEAGSMTAGQLKNILKQSPEVIEMMKDATGKTYPELVKMAKSGKLNSDVMEEMIAKFGEGHKTMDKYAMRAMNVKEVMNELHVGFTEAMLIIGKAKEGYEATLPTFLEMGERMDLAADKAEALAAKMKKIRDAADEMSLATTSFNKLEKMLGHMADASAKVEELRTPMEKYRETVRKFTDDATKSGMASDVFHKSLSRLAETAPGFVNYYKQMLDGIQQPEKDWHGRLGALDSQLGSNAITMVQYEKALRGVLDGQKEVTAQTLLLNAALGEADTKATIKRGPRKLHTGQSQGGQFDEFLDPSVYQESEETQKGNRDLVDTKVADIEYNARSQVEPPDLEKAISQHDKMDALLKSHRELTKKWNEELAKSNVVVNAVESAMQQGAATLGTTLVDAANGAKVSWGDALSSIIKGFENAIVQALILQAVGSVSGGIGGAGTGLLGALFGGAHATGGSFTATGSGGTDSVPVLFRMSPGERADFTPQGQASSASSGGGNGGGGVTVAAPAVHIHTGDDRRALQAAMSGPEGDAIFVELARRNPAAIRRATSR